MATLCHVTFQLAATSYVSRLRPPGGGDQIVIWGCLASQLALAAWPHMYRYPLAGRSFGNRCAVDRHKTHGGTENLLQMGQADRLRTTTLFATRRALSRPVNLRSIIGIHWCRNAPHTIASVLKLPATVAAFAYVTCGEAHHRYQHRKLEHWARHGVGARGGTCAAGRRRVFRSRWA